MFDVFNKIKRKWVRFRLQPIRVFCFHHVCKSFDASSMKQNDWLDIDTFKIKITNMQKMGVQFISLQSAHKHIKHDFVRFRKYAVITFDDGYASLKEVLPWLKQQQIPVTLFINGKYLDGQSYRTNPKEKYLVKDELWAMQSPFIEIGSHGWEHTDASKMSVDELRQYIESNILILQAHPRHIPFHAYTWGRHTKDMDKYLLTKEIVPVYMDGKKNYNNHDVIHRELLG